MRYRDQRRQKQPLVMMMIMIMIKLLWLYRPSLSSWVGPAMKWPRKQAGLRMYCRSRTGVHSRRFVFTHQVAALFCVKWRHNGRLLESVTSNRKCDSVNRCVFTWRTFLPNFIPIQFETTEPRAFLKRSPNTKK